MDVQSNWWNTFFTGPAVEFWVNAVSQEHTAAMVDYATRSLQVRSGAAILDVACGAGRIANALAERGFEVVGVDISTEFLTHAKRQDEQGRVEWHERDMRNLPWSERFDGAVCLGNSFGYLDDEGNVAFINAIAQTLKRGARFLLQTHAIAETVLPTFERQMWVHVGEIYLLLRSAYDYRAGRVETEYTFIDKGHVDVRIGAQRIFTYRQIEDMFKSAGLSVVAAETISGNAGHNPYAEGRMPTEPFDFGARMLLLTVERM